MADSQRIEDLRRRVKKDPASIAFAQLAEELRRAGQLEEAIEICRAGLNIHPGYLSARVTLGRAQLELNQLEEALAELEHVLASAPENLAAIRGVAEIHHRRGDLPAALKQYRAALALARNDPDLQQTVADLAKQVEPPAPVAAEGLTLDHLAQELFKKAPPPAFAPGLMEGATTGNPKPEPEPAQQAEAAQEADRAQQAAPLQVVDVTPAVGADLAPPDSTPGIPNDPEKERDQVSAEVARSARTIAALEGWLGAIHAARTGSGQ